MSGDGWQRSTFCSLGDCVEVKHLPGGGVAVRNSTAPRIHLIFSGEEWRAFEAGMQAGDFKRPEAAA